MSDRESIQEMLKQNTAFFQKSVERMEGAMRDMSAKTDLIHTALMGDVTRSEKGIKAKAEDAYEGVLKLSTRMETTEKEISTIKSDRAKRYHIGYGMALGIGLVFPKLISVFKEHFKVVIFLATGSTLLVIAIIKMN